MLSKRLNSTSYKRLLNVATKRLSPLQSKVSINVM